MVVAVMMNAGGRKDRRLGLLCKGLGRGKDSAGGSCSKLREVRGKGEKKSTLDVPPFLTLLASNPLEAYHLHGELLLSPAHEGCAAWALGLVQSRSNLPNVAQMAQKSPLVNISFIHLTLGFSYW